MTCLGVVPARGGSKAVPRKNLADLCGKPLIWYTLDCAKRATRIDRLIVSTDDDEIAAVAEAEGVCVERRPDWLSGDEVGTIPVLQWHLNQQDTSYDRVICLQPTCPLRRVEDIDGSIALAECHGANCVISIVRVEDEHPARMYRLNPDGRLRSLDPDRQYTRRQDLPDVYRRSGDIYVLSRQSVELGRYFDILPWIIPRERHCNIDSPRDLEWARHLMEKRCSAS